MWISNDKRIVRDLVVPKRVKLVSWTRRGQNDDDVPFCSCHANRSDLLLPYGLSDERLRKAGSGNSMTVVAMQEEELSAKGCDVLGLAARSEREQPIWD